MSATVVAVAPASRERLLECDAVARRVFAFPAVDEHGACLFLAELSVLAEHRSRGIGLRLLAAVRDGALQLGHERMIWTTNALSSRNLHLYLARCRAARRSFVVFRPDGES